MALLESLLLMAAQATAPPPSRAAPPPIELLEFLADWSEDDAKLIDDEGKPADKAARPRKPRERRDSDGEGKTP